MKIVNFENYQKISIGIKKRIWRFLFSSSFKAYGKNSFILNPLKIRGCANIYIGNNVTINTGGWLEANLSLDKKCELVIKDGTQIGHYCHIYSTHSVILEKNVLIADKVYIADNSHNYHDIGIPILKQPIKQLPNVIIGEGTWIGENSVIIGSKIGNNCIIGANSLVNKDIPDNCLAAGTPAKIIKKYNSKSKSWMKNEC